MNNIKENLGKLACMINNMKEHIKALKDMGFSLKQAENYLQSIEMLKGYYEDINDDNEYHHNYYNEDK